MNPTTHPHEFIKHTDPGYIIRPGDVFKAFLGDGFVPASISIGAALRTTGAFEAWTPRPIPPYDTSKYDYVSDPSYVIRAGDMVCPGDHTGYWTPAEGVVGKSLRHWNRSDTFHTTVYGALTPKNVEPKPRFFRHSDGLFEGSYCIEMLGDQTTYIHLDGRRELDAGLYFRWTLERCLYLVSQKLWVEFDGNLEPFRSKKSMQESAQESAKEFTTIEGWLKTLPDGYRERALKNCDPDVRYNRSRSVEHALRGAFIWSQSPEGLDFWVAVKNHLLGRGDLPPLPAEGVEQADELAELRRTLERRNEVVVRLVDQIADMHVALRKIRATADEASRNTTF
jgi:hypothetical protein